jgi:phosphatidylglycerophosphatase A
MGKWEHTRPGVKVSLAVATGFGLGLSPFASGTVATLLGFPLVWVLAELAWPWQIVAALALASLAVPVCELAENWFGRKDDGRIVADEYLTFPLAVLGLPLHEAPLMLPIAFVVARFMDIVKPWPARGLQSVHGGYGIVIDDVFASLYALAVNWAIYKFAYPHLVSWIAWAWPF